ncbi:MAG: hypothetical protein OEN23_04080 [Paracoccaceae bacterium]|nr:hypothetical protein [Paracoccaceae bacterium]
MTSMIDWDAAPERLTAVTSDREVLDGFERLVINRDVDDAFLAAVCRAAISFDYFLLGKGKPYTGKVSARLEPAQM